MDTPLVVGRCADASSHHRSAGYRHPALDAVVTRLTCPHCTGPLHRSARTVRCPSGHTFDIARPGYLSLLPGRRTHRGDDPAMVGARESFLDSDHYRPLRSTITALATEHAPTETELVVDLAGGTGHYLAPVLDALPAASGVIVDLSTAALRRAARAHRRAAAIAADVWQPLPITTGSAGVVLSVFGPRNAEEVERVLPEGGILVVASARPDHLRELRAHVGGIGVDPQKADRHRRAFAGLELAERQIVQWRLALGRDEARALVRMGPNAHHLGTGGDDDPLSRLPEPVGLTAAMDVAVYRRRRSREPMTGEVDRGSR
ncbi:MULTISPECIES: putative RNA methyltransferase [Pseudonocardia]|uniref:23S rRNA (Guanine(748)-N(1))-methyltransferase n=2 Tax=Pseudonocardia TaxID=1847 RepID=A0A1Y2MSG1_PSEAH|nr:MULTISPECIES: hypothetical protein [Pseudonocardia]OSY38071.1 23S rRNA (guanine(748)-N(1))-methyltransferase [Pseudonocardia autotrophica]TDN75513.1 23S rRNA m(1)G-748 methyltransferase [Pseudonocardia autotrophica]BBF99481.1 ubiquinone biosynthesis protein [Pseudonocardia autotrophica]GEC28482.1 ubiquinone biosynthesis protein [Pseudonocardia saturnea]